jgi:hypothetical protein
VLLAAAMLTRTIGVALVLAVVAAEALRFARQRDFTRARRTGAAVLASMALTGVWYAVRPAGGEDQYAVSLAVMRDGATMDAIGWFAGAIASNAQSIAAAWLHALLIFWGEPTNPRFIIAAALGLAGLAASVYRAEEGHLDGLYVCVFLALLLLWPYPGQMYRLAFPAAPLVLVHAIWGLRAAIAQAASAIASERWAAAAIALPLAAWRTRRAVLRGRARAHAR